VAELRLFPLQTVLFPGMALPLNIFEDRYRQLVSECVEASEPFGVALIREGEEVGEPATPHELGTTARIESVKHDEEGHIQLLATGEKRFRVTRLHHDRPYLWADVEYPDEDGSDVLGPLLEQARERYAVLMRLRLASGGEYVRDIPTPDEPGAVADAAGAAVTATPSELQELLAMLDVSQRVKRAVELLDQAVPLARRRARTARYQRHGGLASLN